MKIGANSKALALVKIVLATKISWERTVGLSVGIVANNSGVIAPIPAKVQSA